jgi:hypothetical protein
VDAVAEDRDEAGHQPPPGLGADPLGQLHRPDGVGEEDGDLLALALERRPSGADLRGQMLRRGGQRRRRQRVAAGVAEPRRRRIRRSAGGADDPLAQRRAALGAEACALTIGVAARSAVHAAPRDRDADGPGLLGETYGRGEVAVNRGAVALDRGGWRGAAPPLS